MANTGQRMASVPAGGDDRRAADAARARELVEIADDLAADPILTSGEWPDGQAVDTFLEDDRFERILGLYCRAMRLDPLEPAYPWNLASVMSRLGFDDLAVVYLGRAITVARAVGDEEWSDAAAHLAWADAALRAGQDLIAAVALAAAAQSARPGWTTTAALDRMQAELSARQSTAGSLVADVMGALQQLYGRPLDTSGGGGGGGGGRAAGT